MVRLRLLLGCVLVANDLSCEMDSTGRFYVHGYGQAICVVGLAATVAEIIMLKEDCRETSISEIVALPDGKWRVRVSGTSAQLHVLP